jgi:hypothetical protein
VFSLPARSPSDGCGSPGGAGSGRVDEKKVMVQRGPTETFPGPAGLIRPLSVSTLRRSVGGGQNASAKGVTRGAAPRKVTPGQPLVRARFLCARFCHAGTFFMRGACSLREARARGPGGVHGSLCGCQAEPARFASPRGSRSPGHPTSGTHSWTRGPGFRSQPRPAPRPFASARPGHGNPFSQNVPMPHHGASRFPPSWGPHHGSPSFSSSRLSPRPSFRGGHGGGGMHAPATGHFGGGHGGSGRHR